MSRPKNILTNKTASVTIHRNGLSVEIQAVAATDAGLVSQALLDMVRNLIDAGYEELVVDAGGTTSGAFGEMPEDDGIETSTDTPVLRKRPIGFTR